MTRMGMLVIVAPGDVVPVEITVPVLFQSNSGADAAAATRVNAGAKMQSRGHTLSQ